MGISTSVSNEVGGLLKDWLKNPLNASFVYWYFLPAVGFVLLQLFVIGPALGHQVPDVVPQKDGVQNESVVGLIVQLLRGSVFWLMLLPLMIGVVMSSLSGTTLRLYRGTLPVARVLFQPWLSRNRKRSTEMFGRLPFLRRQYMFLVSVGANLVTVDGEDHLAPVAETKLPELIDQLKREIQEWHERFESGQTGGKSTPNDGALGQKGSASVLDGPPPEGELPMDLGRVGPNKLANTLAVAEEYPFERYGMDASVFWPRISAEIEAEKLDSLTSSYGALRGLLNLSLLSCLSAIESLTVGLGIWKGWIHPVALTSLRLSWLFVVAPISILIGLGAYRGAVGMARSVGNAMRTAFDYYRGQVLHRFNLKMPDDIDEERVMWLKLAAFLRRGESFYFPSEWRLDGKE